MNKNTIAIVIGLIAIILAVMNLISIGQLNSSMEAKGTDAPVTPITEEKYEVAKAMGYMQRFSTKLYWAGSQENWELSEFYAHELEETIEEISEADVIDEGFAVSEMVTKMSIPAFEQVEEAIKKQDKSAFESSYQLLIQSCNACHAASKHAFIEIKVPELEGVYNQKFSK
ncbi:hypothetical protein JKA74_04360 [Marivirga sp. S37H4]|uniref:Cytochrome c domain-containing protein n=1 Tax=Marivirga aurantiaca TaxID=2802615 RepID=A0A934WWG8_9BACT|nr:hypothetical protein [Marivirga aurantiaca]MBK6264259.1 hypothetical protein [Marivirga aurantiaca]